MFKLKEKPKIIETFTKIALDTTKMVVIVIKDNVKNFEGKVTKGKHELPYQFRRFLRKKMHLKIPKTVPRKFNEQRQLEFLSYLADSGLLTDACSLANITASTVRKYRKRDTNFDNACKLAIERSSDKLEMEARRRALEGIDEPVFYQGDVVGYVRKYSDSLLQFLLRGNRPEKFRENSTTVNNINGVSITNFSDMALALSKQQEIE